MAVTPPPAPVEAPAAPGVFASELDDQRHEQRELLQDIDDIYTHADKLKKSVSQYLTGANQE